MPRIARKKSDSNFHHIIVQGINKIQPILYTATDHS